MHFLYNSFLFLTNNILFLYKRVRPEVLDYELFDIDFPNFSDIGRSIGGLLCRFIYELIVNLYNLFMSIAQVSFINSSDLKMIYQKITLILTMVMVFYVTFQTVKYVIQPDTMGDKEQGASKIVTKMILVVLLIAMVPNIFDLSRKLQKGIIESNIIPKIFTTSGTAASNNQGQEFSADLLSAFYYENYPGETHGCNIPDRGASPVRNCDERVSENLQSLRQNGTIPYLGRGLWEYKGSDVSKYYIHFDWLLAAAVGAFIVYILVLYCIDAGVRVAQLAFLEIIAPIPIIGYLSPKKDGMFERWVKQCITTYLDLFIRMIILYVVFLIANMLGQAYSGGLGRLYDGITPTPSTTMKVFIFVALILGLFLFAKKAPKLIEELMPKGLSSAASGNFGLKQKDRLSAISRGAGAAIGGAKFARNAARRLIASGKRNKENREQRKKAKEAKKQGKRDAKTARRNARAANRINKAGMRQRKADAKLANAREKLANAKDAKQTTRAANESLRAQKKLDAANEKLKNAQNIAAYGKNGARSISRAEKLHGEVAARNEEEWQAGKMINKIEKGKTKRMSEYAIASANQKKADRELKDAQDKYGMAQAAYDKIKNDPNANENAKKLLANEAANAKMRLDKAEAEKKQRDNDMTKFAFENQQLNDAKNAKDAAKQKASDDAAELTKIRNNPNATPEEIIEATKKMEASQKAAKEADEKYQKLVASDTGSENLNKIMEESNIAAQRAQELKKEYQQVKRHSITGDILGAVKDTGHEIKAGLKTTEMKDVFKNQTKSEQEVIKNVDELYKYYDTGGIGGASGTVDRVVTNYAKKHGYETAYERTMLHTRTMEPQIKRLDAQSATIKDVKTHADGAEDRLKSKVDELKLETSGGIKTGLKDANGHDIVTTAADGKTIGEVSRAYKGKATAAQAEAENAAKRYNDFMASSVNKILDKDFRNLEDRELDELAKFTYGTDDYRKLTNEQNANLEQAAKNMRETIRKEKEAKAKASSDAQYQAEQVQKYLARYEYTEILKEFADGKSVEQINASGKYDGPAVEQIKNTLESIKLATRDPIIVEDIRNRLSDHPEKFAAFMSGRILDFDTLDDIKTIALNAQAEYDRASRELKQDKSNIENSRTTQAQKAANDYNPQGGNGS